MNDRDITICRLNGKIYNQRNSLLSQEICIQKIKEENKKLKEKLIIAKEALGDVINRIDCEQPDLATFIAVKAIEKIEE